MSNVEFQEEVRGRVRGEKVSFITKLLMKMGVKDEKQANKVMLGIIVLCVLLTIVIIWSSGSTNSTPGRELGIEELQQLKEMGVIIPE